MNTGFDINLAYRYALLSQAAYTAVPTIYDRATDTSVIITETELVVEIGFPGTHDFADVLKDLEVLRTDEIIEGVHVGVHSGFEKAWVGIMRDVIAKLDTIPSYKPVYTYGHSKGGGEATRCAVDVLKFTDHKVAGVYTYGEPRGGNHDYAQMCDVLFGPKHWRIEDGDDAICRLPGWLAGNRHSGHCVLLNANNPSYKIDPNNWFKICSDMLEIWEARWKGNLLVLGEDHHVGKYVARLKRIMVMLV